MIVDENLELEDIESDVQADDDEPIELPIDDGESDDDDALVDLPDDDDDEGSDPGDENDAPEIEPVVAEEKPKAPAPKAQTGINEDALARELDLREAKYAQAYEARTGFAPLESDLATFRYMEEQRIRDSVAAKQAQDARRIAELESQKQVYVTKFTKLGNAKAADHFIEIVRDNGADVLDNPLALQAAEDMALGRAIREQGIPKAKPNLPKGQPPSANDSGYTAAERQALKEMRQSGLNPKTRKELKEWMAL